MSNLSIKLNNDLNNIVIDVFKIPNTNKENMEIDKLLFYLCSDKFSLEVKFRQEKNECYFLLFNDNNKKLYTSDNLANSKLEEIFNNFKIKINNDKRNPITSDLVLKLVAKYGKLLITDDIYNKDIDKISINLIFDKFKNKKDLTKDLQQRQIDNSTKIYNFSFQLFFTANSSSEYNEKKIIPENIEEIIENYMKTKYGFLEDLNSKLDKIDKNELKEDKFYYNEDKSLFNISENPKESLRKDLEEVQILKSNRPQIKLEENKMKSNSIIKNYNIEQSPYLSNTLSKIKVKSDISVHEINNNNENSNINKEIIIINEKLENYKKENEILKLRINSLNDELIESKNNYKTINQSLLNMKFAMEYEIQSTFQKLEEKKNEENEKNKISKEIETLKFDCEKLIEKRRIELCEKLLILKEDILSCNSNVYILDNSLMNSNYKIHNLQKGYNTLITSLNLNKNINNIPLIDCDDMYVKSNKLGKCRLYNIKYIH